MAFKPEIPKLSKDLIRDLNTMVPRATLPSHFEGWKLLDQQALLAMAFRAGYRALVDTLVDQQAEDRENLLAVTGREDDGEVNLDVPVLNHSLDKAEVRLARVLRPDGSVGVQSLRTDDVDT